MSALLLGRTPVDPHHLSHRLVANAILSGQLSETSAAFEFRPSLLKVSLGQHAV